MKHFLFMNAVRPVFVLAFCLLFFAECAQDKQVQVFSDEKLAHLMADLAVADAATTGMVGYTKDSLSQVYFAQVFELNGIKKEEYEKDLMVLSQDIEHYKRVQQAAKKLLDKK